MVINMTPRTPFQTRTMRLVSHVVRDSAVRLLGNLPLDPDKPLELVIREERKARAPDHNAAYWSGPLRDIATQAWIDGRQYSAEVLHEHYKREYLPEEADPELTCEGYRKWDFTPAGERVLVGSTTQLTRKGFALYLVQVEAFGAQLGVQFSAPPRMQQR